jgi:hypothetical protein
MLSHTGTGEWQSFELRMRRRRAERLVLRAQAAADAGCPDDARACLAEARGLDATVPGIAELERQLSPPEAPVSPPAPRHNIVVAVIASAATVVLAGWAVFPRPNAGTPSAAPAPQLRSQTPPAPQLRSQEPPAPAPQLRSEAPPAPNAEALPAPAAVFAAEVAAATPTNPPAAPADRTATPATPAERVRPEPPVALARTTESAPAVPPIRSLLPPAEPVRPEVVTPVAARPSPPPVIEPAPAPVPAPPSAPIAAATPDLAAAAPSITPSVPAPPAPSQEPAVRSVLSRYASAYSMLDVAAAHRVWPGVNRAALSRAFDSLASQRISFDDCQIDVTGASARARCAGTATWSPKIGGGGVQQEARSWAFELARASEGWKIVSARVQNR